MSKKNHSKLIAAAWETWGQLECDAHSLCNEIGEPLTNEGAVEFIIDADRISTIAGFSLSENGYTYSEAEKILLKEDFV